MENEKELSFEELFNESLKEKESKLEKTVTGKIISITEQGEIFVDINYKADGIIPKKEYSNDENANPKDEFKVGDTITGILYSVSPETSLKVLLPDVVDTKVYVLSVSLLDAIEPLRSLSR